MGGMFVSFLVSHFLQGTYCFQPGVLAGFTGFALAVLIAWTSPMLVTALWVSNKPKRESEINVEAFLKIWSLLTGLWFIFPCAWFISDPFFRRDGFGIILAVTIAAAFPLSWHLSLVAVLSTTLGETLGMTRSSTLAVHKVVGYGAACWAAVHAIGELVYFSRHGWDFFWRQLSLAKAEDGENLLYILGIVAFVVFAVHMVLVQVRKSVSNFKNLHRAGAALLLLIATAHWWPFALFLLPAAAGQGFCFASQVAERAGFPQTQQRKSQALFAALFGSLVGLSLVWILRQRVTQDGASLLTPLFSHLQQFWRSLFQGLWFRSRFCSESPSKALKLWPSMHRSVWSLHEPPGALGLEVSRSLKKTTSMMNQGWWEIGYLKHPRLRGPLFFWWTHQRGVENSLSSNNFAQFWCGAFFWGSEL